MNLEIRFFLIDILIIAERPESSIPAICRTRTSLIIYKNLIEMREWMLNDFKKKYVEYFVFLLKI